MESSDLIAYGLIPEFIGRFPVLVSLAALNEDQLVQVWPSSENYILHFFQYPKAVMKTFEGRNNQSIPHAGLSSGLPFFCYDNIPNA